MVRYLFPIAAILLSLLMLPLGCSQDSSTLPVESATPQIRVLLLQDVDHVNLAAEDPQVSDDSQPADRAGLFPAGFSVPVSLGADGWHIGRLMVHSGVLTLRPTTLNPMQVNGAAYRGRLRLVPCGSGRFDLINDIGIEDYLLGVVTREMYSTWPIEAIKAQAVASRTYALYESHWTGIGRQWDVFADERSQMYGGVGGETAQSRQAVAETAGIVLTYGPGDGKIFRAYFSSCCGGVSQAAADAFPGEPYIPPLAEQYRGNLSSASPYFNWGPITIKKAELTRRVHLWATRRAKELGREVPELSISGILRVDIQGVNRYGRPNRVLVTDARGIQYSWTAEDLRSAVDTDAQLGTTLPSSFCKISAGPNSDSVTFYEGHGLGHGVGMCQWTARARAAAGQTCEQILGDAYPQSKLVRAY
jgi:stage II sporulation protein D